MLVLKSRIDVKPQFLYAKTQSRKQTNNTKGNIQYRSDSLCNTFL